MLNNKIIRFVWCLFITVLLIGCLAGCQNSEPIVETEPFEVEKDLFYFNIDKAINNSVERQKDRVSGLFTFRFLKDGQIIELQTGRDNIPTQLDNLKAVVLTFDDEGYIKKLQSAQSSIGGQFFDNVKVLSVEGNVLNLDSRVSSVTLAEDVNIYDLSGTTLDIGAFGQVMADDTVCLYSDSEGMITQVYVISRRMTHDDKHVCDHCSTAVEWQIWDGAQALTSGHYCLASDVELQETQVLKNEDVVLCLNGYTLQGRCRLFELNKGATLSVLDHAGHTGSYYGSMIGGGINVKDKDPKELVGGTVLVDDTSALNIMGGNIGVDLPVDGSRYINMGGVVYSAGAVKVSGGVVTGADVGYNGGAIHIAEKGSFELSGGVIQYGSAFKKEKISGSGCGGTIYIHKGAKSAAITGGKLIAGVVDGYGGGIYTGIGMTISNATLCGDRIDGKALAEYGGVFWLGGNETVVDINAGTVFENGSSVEGGNIGHRSTAIVNVNDGAIIRNGYGSRNGGNIGSFGTLNVNGGQIIDGYSDGGGGNIYGFSNGYTYVNIYGGVIANGSGTRGGNIYMSGNKTYEQGSVLTITGGEIINGVARTDTGGNIAVRAHSEAYITGGKITGGTAEKNGGGLSTYFTSDNNLVPKVELGGSAYISGNASSDVYIYPNTVLAVMADSPFTADAKIGITADDTTVALVTGAFKEDLSVFSWTSADKTLVIENDQIFAK